jgi:inhibitor of cysteine peptidase
MKAGNNTLLGILVLFAIVIVTIATFSLGCTETPYIPDNGTDDDKTDTNNDKTNGEYVYSDAAVENVDILILESFPVQIHVKAIGYLPDGCTEIHEKNVKYDRETKSFTVHITTIRPADAICTEAIVPFESTIPLDAYGLDKGVYNVNVNGVQGQFELQTDNIIPA